MRNLCAAAVLAAMVGACDVPPPEEKPAVKQESRAEAWHGAMSRLEPGRPPRAPALMTPVEGDLERRQQAIGWYGGEYGSWGRCNLPGWPTCGGWGYIAFYRGVNYGSEGIQFWPLTGNYDVWVDFDYYTWNDGTNVNNTIRSLWIWRPYTSSWTQKLWLCANLGCSGSQSSDFLEYWTLPQYHPSGTGDADVQAVMQPSAFWFMNNY